MKRLLHNSTKNTFPFIQPIIKTLFVVCFFLVGMSMMGQTSIWTNPIIGTDPGILNPYTTGDVKNTNITVSGIGRGTSLSADTSTDSYDTSGWTTATTIDLNGYFNFTITPGNGYKVSMNNFVYVGTGGAKPPTSFAFRSNANANNFTSDIGTPSATGTTINLSTTVYQDLSASTTFRLYGWNRANGSDGTWAINDFTFNGTVLGSGTTALGFGSNAYGSAPVQTFQVNGAGLNPTNATIIINGSANYEVSTTSSTAGFGATATLTASGGNLSSANVWVRLKATSAVGTYNENITFGGGGVTGITIPCTGTVTTAPLTITGLTADNKIYNGLTTATLSGTAAYAGLQNSESFAVTGTPIASFATASVGNTKAVTISGYTAPSSNYTITQPSLTANITKAVLTITAANQSVSYGTAVATVTSAGTYIPTGFVNSETAAVIGGSASFTTTYTTTTDTGTLGVTITPIITSLTATNYDFSAVNGTITITKANSSITATSTTSYTYNGLTQGPSTSNVTGSLGAVTYSYTGTGTTTYGPSATLPINTGTYQVVATVATDTNYNGATSSPLAFTITAASLTITGISADNKIYDGLTTATLSGTAAYSGLQNGEGFSVTGTPSASFATATVGTGKIVTVSGYTAPSSNYTVSQPSLSAAITKAVLIITAANQSVSYGTAVATITSAGTYIPTGFVNSETAAVIGGSASYTTTYTTTTDTGTLGVTITPIITSLTATNYNFNAVNGTIIVSLATPTVTPTVGIYTYTGLSQGPNAATNTGTGTSYTYSYVNSGGTTYGPSATAPTNAGNYTVTVTVAADGNYAATSSIATMFTINKANPTATLAVNNSPTTYTGTAQSATVSISASSVAGTVTTILTGGSATQTAAGTYAVTASFVPTDSANYNTITNLSAGNFVINKATPTATLAVNNSPTTYTGAAQSATVSISASSVAGTVTTILTGGSATQTAAGTYAVTASFVPTDSANYNTITNLSAGNFVINKATPTATLAVNNSPTTYTGAAQSATVSISASSVAGTVTTILTGGSATQTAAGTYAVTASFVPTDSANYNTITNLSAGNFVINKATPTATLAVNNSPTTYTGAAQSATVSISASSVAGTVTTILTGGSATQTAAGTYAVTASFVPTDSANYNTITNLSAGNFVINKATPTATLAVNNSPTTYTGAAQSATVSISASSVAGTVTTILTGGSATQTAAGTYAVTASFVPTDSANYNTITNLSAGNFVINKATPTATLAVNNSPTTYTGAAQSATVSISASSVAGTVTTILTGGSATQTAAGTYAVTASFVPTDSANYNTITNLSAGNFVINKATPTATLAVNNSPTTYTGAAQSATVSISASSVAGTVTTILTGGSATQTAAGTYAVTASFVPTDSANYNTITNLSAGNFVINKATPTATLAVNNSPTTYTGAAQSATVSISAGSVAGTVTTILTGGSATQTAAGTYAVTASFVPTDSANYNTITNLSAGNFVINKATPTATLAVNNSPTTYTGAAQSATVSISASSVAGTVTTILTGGSATQTAAGTYAVTASFVPTDSANYNTITNLSAGNFVINKATPTATLAVNNSPTTYTGAAQSATVSISASSVAGTVTTILTGGSATQTAAGTYAVTASFVPTDSANYNTITNLSAGNFVIIPANPTSASTVASSICIGGSTTLSLNGGGGEAGALIKWYTGSCGGTIVGTGNGLSVSPIITTTYYGRYEGVFTTACASVIITVNPLPTANAGFDSTIFRGNPTTTPLGATAVGSNTYSWVSNPIGFTSSISNPTVSPLVNTTYTLTETTPAGCVKSNSVTVTVRDNLVVSKSIIGAVPTKPGDAVTYQISYNNLNNGVAAENITITDILPSTAYFTYTSSTPTGTYNAGSNSLTYTLASLAAGASGSITVSGTVGVLGGYGYNSSSYYISSGSSTQTITNSASIVNPITPALVSNVSNTVTQNCGVSMPAKLSGKIHTSSNSNVYYFIEVQNTGNITDRFTLTNNNPIQTPPNVDINSVITDIAGNTITQTPWLTPGQKYGFLVQFTNQGTATDRYNYSSIVATSSVCTTSATTLIDTYVYNTTKPTDCDLLITKTASSNSVVAGANIIYTITARNLYSYNANDLVIDDILPANLNYISATQTGADNITYNSTSRLIRVTRAGNYDNSNPNIVITITAQTTCASVPSVTNSASVDNKNEDSNVLNNDSSVTVTVLPNVSDPLPTSAIICSGNSTTISMPVAGANRNYKWYSAATGGTLLQTNGNTYTTGTLTSSTTFYVSQYNTLDSACESNRTAIPITVVSTPVVIAQPADITVCSTTASFTFNVSGSYLSQQWQVSIDGGNNWSNLTDGGVYSGVTNQTLNISNLAGLWGYKYRCNLNSFSCYALTSDVATVVSLPTITGTLSVCSGSTTTLTGSGIPDPTNPWASSNLAVATVNSSGVVTGVSAGTTVITYKSSNNCTITATVTVNGLPNNISNGFSATTICFGGTPLLTFDAENSSFSTPYSVTYRNDITLTQYTATIPNASAYNFTAGDNPTSNSGYTIVSISNAFCTRTSGFMDSGANLSVRPLPIATISGTTSVCSGSPSPNIVFANPQTVDITVTYTINGVSHTINVGNNSSSSVAASTTVSGSFVYNLVSVAYQSTPNCSNTLTGSATVTINPLPSSPSLVTTQPNCALQTGTITINSVAGETYSFDGGSYSGTLVYSSLAQGSTHTVSSMNTFGCISATSSTVTISSLVINTWTTTGWSSGIPDLNTLVIIDANYNTSTHGDLNACSVTVNLGKTLTITPDDYATIQNDLTVNGRVDVLDKGSLVMINDAGTVTNNGTTTVRRFTSPFEKFDYVYWSTPIESTFIPSTFLNWRTNYAFEFLPANFIDANNDSFDDDGNDWSYASTMTPGKGFIVMTPTNKAMYPSVEEIVFSGKVNNGVITAPINLTPSTTDPKDDFNLVGNPYPSAIDADKFILANINSNLNTGSNKIIDGTLYFWTHIGDISNTNGGPDGLNFSTNDYAVYTLAGGVGTSGNIINGNPQNSNKPNGFIASGQGFFVEADNAGTLLFNNSMRVGTETKNNQFYKVQSNKSKTTTASKDRLWLNLQNTSNLFSQQLIGYFDNATLGYDKGYDGPFSNAGNAINFYSFIEDTTYKIQGRSTFDENDQVRLGYSSTIAGTFTIAIDTKEGVFTNTNQAVYIEDKVTNTIFDLKNGAYNFTTEKGTFNERFILRYTDKTLGLNEVNHNEAIVVFYSNNYKTVIIKNNSDAIINSVSLFNMSGQNSTNWDVKDPSQTTIHIPIKNVSSGAYIVKITTTKGEISKKIIIK